VNEGDTTGNGEDFHDNFFENVEADYSLKQSNTDLRPNISIVRRNSVTAELLLADTVVY
jgi:hypothetical protein